MTKGEQDTITNAQSTTTASYCTMGILGAFNPKNNKITIYRDGNKINVLKHGFIHYLREIKRTKDFDAIDWGKYADMNYGEFTELHKNDMEEDEELATRKLTCAGWDAIYNWFHSTMNN